MSIAPYHVLVVDDQGALAPELRSRGFDVQTASFEALIAAPASQRFDLILLDLHGDTPPALERFAQAHSLFAQTPFIVLLDDDQQEPGLRMLQLGAQDFLPRSAGSPAVLDSAIRKALARHRSQDASRRDRHLLEILMNNIPDSIYFKDTESCFIRINKAQARRFGLSNPAHAVGKTDADFFSDAHAKQALVDEQDAMRTGKPLVGIEEMETWPDGSITWVSTTKVPLRDPSGRVIGTFGISRDITARKKAELALEERTHQLQQRNEQIADELRMARELQLAMLPQKFPCLPPHLPYQESALEFFSLFLPNGEVSGDFYDVVELSDTKVGVFICDVMGHDVRAALITAMMRSLVQDLSDASLDPGNLMEQINHALAGVFKLSGTTMFATAMYLIADVERGELRYSSAAHPDALCLRRGSGEVERVGGPGSRKGPALGLFEDRAFPTCRHQMAVGDLLLLFTDGLIEAEGRNHECFSVERLMAAVKARAHLPPSELFPQLLGDIQQFCGCAEFTDDVSVLGVAVKRLGPPPESSCPVDPILVHAK